MFFQKEDGIEFLTEKKSQLQTKSNYIIHAAAEMQSLSIDRSRKHKSFINRHSKCVLIFHLSTHPHINRKILVSTLRKNILEQFFFTGHFTTYIFHCSKSKFSKIQARVFFSFFCVCPTPEKTKIDFLMIKKGFSNIFREFERARVTEKRVFRL